MNPKSINTSKDDDFERRRRPRRSGIDFDVKATLIIRVGYVNERLTIECTDKKISGYGKDVLSAVNDYLTIRHIEALHEADFARSLIGDTGIIRAGIINK